MVEVQKSVADTEGVQRFAVAEGASINVYGAYLHTARDRLTTTGRS